jgi:hypothetical protein
VADQGQTADEAAGDEPDNTPSAEAATATSAEGAAVTSGVTSASYRWYLGAQVLSLVGTMMSYTALFWLALHVPHGGAPALAAVDAAQCLPMLLFSRRAGLLVARHRAARVMRVTQTLEAASALAIGVPLLAGWMTIWYLVALSFATGCVLCVDLPARQAFMLDLTGPAELRRGTSLFATCTGLARIAGPGIAGVVIATTGETAVFFFNAVSFLAVIAVLTRLPALDPAPRKQSPQVPAARRFRWLADLPGQVRAAAAMALLVGGFGWQFAVTNPLVARLRRVRAGRCLRRRGHRVDGRRPLGPDRPRPGHRRRRRRPAHPPAAPAAPTDPTGNRADSSRLRATSAADGSTVSVTVPRRDQAAPPGRTRPTLVDDVPTSTPR